MKVTLNKVVHIGTCGAPAFPCFFPMARCASILGLGLLAALPARATVIIADDFNRTGALIGSAPSTVVGGGLVWTNFAVSLSDSSVITNGTVAVLPSGAGPADDREPSLDFTLTPNALTTISAVFFPTGGTWNGTSFSGWLGMGFLDASAALPGIFSSAGPMIGISGDGRIWTQAAYTTSSVGYATHAGSATSAVPLAIQIDNRNPNAITATFFTGSSVLATYNFGSAGFAADHLVLRSYLDGGGTVDDFTVSVSVADGGHPASLWAVVGLIASWAGCRHQRRGLKDENRGGGSADC